MPKSIKEIRKDLKEIDNNLHLIGVGNKNNTDITDLDEIMERAESILSWATRMRKIAMIRH